MMQAEKYKQSEIIAEPTQLKIYTTSMQRRICIGNQTIEYIFNKSLCAKKTATICFLIFD